MTDVISQEISKIKVINMSGMKGAHRCSPCCQHDGSEHRAKHLCDHEAEYVEAHHAPEEEHIDCVEQVIVPQHDQAVYCVLLVSPCASAFVYHVTMLSDPCAPASIYMCLHEGSLRATRRCHLLQQQERNCLCNIEERPVPNERQLALKNREKRSRQCVLMIHSKGLQKKGNLCQSLG